MPFVADLRDAVEGDVVTASDPSYDELRAVWNGAVDRHPAAIVCAESTDDVAAAIATARAHDVPLAVRGAGHHVTGIAVVDDSIVVDCRELTDVTIDPDARTARVGPGVRVSDVLDPAQEHGLAPIAGSAAQNGVAGSTLAGGIGWLRRAHGLGIDNLRSVELVTVDGEVVTASETDHPELFWAVRGGGPNVGVVTAFEFDLVPVGPEVAVAQSIYSIDAAGDVLRAYREYAADAPNEVTTLVVLLRIPPLPMIPPEAVGVPVVMVYGVYAGDPTEGESVLAPLRELGEPMMDMSGVQPLSGVHEVARELFPDARHYAWHSMYATALDDDTLDAMVEALLAAPADECDIGIWHMGGAIGDVANDATAFGFRDAEFMLEVGAGWDDPETTDEARAWARELWETLRDAPSAMDGFYPGFPGPVEGEERARMAYGENYERLAEIKAEWDPENVFRHNLNVEPAA